MNCIKIKILYDVGGSHHASSSCLSASSSSTSSPTTQDSQCGGKCITVPLHRPYRCKRIELKSKSTQDESTCEHPVTPLPAPPRPKHAHICRLLAANQLPSADITSAPQTHWHRNTIWTIRSRKESVGDLQERQAGVLGGGGGRAS